MPCCGTLLLSDSLAGLDRLVVGAREWEVLSWEFDCARTKVSLDPAPIPASPALGSGEMRCLLGPFLLREGSLTACCHVHAQLLAARSDLWCGGLFLLKTEVFLLGRENGSNSCTTKADKGPSLFEIGVCFRSLKQVSLFSWKLCGEKKKSSSHIPWLEMQHRRGGLLSSYHPAWAQGQVSPEKRPSLPYTVLSSKTSLAEALPIVVGNKIFICPEIWTYLPSFTLVR